MGLGSTRLKGNGMSDVEEKPKQGSRWVKVALGVSLSINLLIAGLAIGTFSKVQKDGVQCRSNQAVGAYTFALSPKDRRDIGREIGAQTRKGSASPEAIRLEYEHMTEILVAEKFDREAARAVRNRQFEFLNVQS